MPTFGLTRKKITRSPVLRALFRAGIRLGALPEYTVVGEVEGVIHVDGFRYDVDRSDSYGQLLFWTSRLVRDPAYRLWKQWCRTASTAVDVGAHTGLFSLAAAHQGVHVHAFEPLPSVYKIFERNVRVNAFGNRIDLHAVACGAEKGEAKLSVPVDQTMGSLAASASTGAVNTFRVPVYRLDDLKLGKVDLLKIDVESFEPEVIEGARKLLEQDRPRVIFECWEEAAGERLTRQFHELNYSLAHIGRDRLEPIERIRTGYPQHLWNFAAAPRETR